jgi:hypothetical protein
MIRIRVRVSEPVDLFLERRGEGLITGELLANESDEYNLVIRPERDSRLGGRLLKTVRLWPYLEGHTFRELDTQTPVHVAGEAEAEGGLLWRGPVRFLGTAIREESASLGPI